MQKLFVPKYMLIIYEDFFSSIYFYNKEENISNYYFEFWFNNPDDLFNFIIEHSKDFTKSIENKPNRFDVAFKENKDKAENSCYFLLETFSNIFNTNIINNVNWKKFMIHFELYIPDLQQVYQEKNGYSIPKRVYNYRSLFDYNESNNLYLNRINEIKDLFNMESNNNNFNMENTTILKVFHCNNTNDLLISFFSLLFILHPKAKIIKCDNCNKWFIPKKSDSKYCNKVSPQYKNKSCKEAMILINKLKNENSSESKKLHKKIYNNYRSAYVSYENKKNEEEFIKFKKENKEWQRKYKNGEILENDYIIWLNSNYKRKKIGEE